MRSIQKWMFYLSKEIGHNKRILVVVLLAITFATAATIFISGVTTGFLKDFERRTIDLTTAHVIIKPEEGSKTINDLDETKDVLRETNFVTSFTARTVTPAIIENIKSNKTLNIKLIGVDPEDEKRTTTIARHISRGRFVESSDKNKVVVGVGVLDEIDLNKEVPFNATITLPNAEKKDVEVVGILKSEFKEVDDSSVFVSKDYLDEVLQSENKANIILVKTTDINNAPDYAKDLQDSLNEVEVSSWEKDAEFLLTIKGNMQFLFTIIRFLSLIGSVIPVSVVLYINIINRTKEIGIYKALGATNSFIMMLFVSMSVIIGLIGIALGCSLAAGLIYYFQSHPLSVKSPITTATVAPVLSPEIFITTALIVFVAIVIASSLPARKAAKINPVEAFRIG